MKTALLATFLVLMAGAAQAQCLNEPLRPVMSTHTPLPLSGDETKGAQKKYVRLAVTLNDQGVPVTVEVVESSGSARLDEIARSHVLAEWRWIAPTRNCAAFGVTTRINVLLP